MNTDTVIDPFTTLNESMKHQRKGLTQDPGKGAGFNFPLTKRELIAAMIMCANTMKFGTLKDDAEYAIRKADILIEELQKTEGKA